MIVTGNKYGKLIQKEPGKIAHYSPKSWNVINNKWLDISGNRYHNLIGNGLSLVKNGILFPENNQTVLALLDTSPNIPQRTVWTFSASFTPNGTGAGTGFMQYPNSIMGFGDQLRYWTLTGGYYTLAYGVYVIGKRINFSVISDGTNISCYVNGTLHNTITPNSTLIGIDKIGQFAGVYLRGVLHEYRFDNYAFTHAQAVAYHNSFNI